MKTFRLVMTLSVFALSFYGCKNEEIQPKKAKPPTTFSPGTDTPPPTIGPKG